MKKILMTKFFLRLKLCQVMPGDNILPFFTSAKEVVFSPGFVYVFVSLFGNKITQKLTEGF